MILEISCQAHIKKIFRVRIVMLVWLLRIVLPVTYILFADWTSDMFCITA